MTDEERAWIRARLAPKPGEPQPGDLITVIVVEEKGRDVIPHVRTATVITREEVSCDETKVGCVVVEKGRSTRFTAYLEWEGWAWARGTGEEVEACLMATWALHRAAGE